MPEDFHKVKGFFVYFDQCEALEDLTDEQAGMLFKGIVARFQGREFDFTDQTVRVVFRFLRLLSGKSRKNTSRYAKSAERISRNAGIQTKTKRYKTIQKIQVYTNVFQTIQTKKSDTKHTILKPRTRTRIKYKYKYKREGD